MTFLIVIKAFKLNIIFRGGFAPLEFALFSIVILGIEWGMYVQLFHINILGVLLEIDFCDEDVTPVLGK